MSNSTVDHKRRRFLVTATSVVGAAGAVAAGVPFVSSFLPSARTLNEGAPVEINISKLEVGSRMTSLWRGKPVWVVRRAQEVLDRLPENNALLKDPESNVASQQPAYAKNIHRSEKAEFLVLVGVCTHLGCSPQYRPEVGDAALGADWNGGFYCACHGSRFDLAGRVFQNVPAGTNLEVPPYKFKTDDTILVGVDGGAA